MNLPGKRALLGTAMVAAALGVGGVAYATSSDPAPDQSYVTVEEDTPAPSTNQPGTSSDSRTADGRDCPEKDGNGQAQPEQGESAPGESAQGLA